MKLLSEGKVRKLWSVSPDDSPSSGQDTLVIEATDRVSAFDSVLPVEVPYKGEVLTSISQFWFGCTEAILGNHMISVSQQAMPIEFRKPMYAGRVMLVKKMTMFPIESIVRGNLTGSAWKSYQKDGTAFGIKLPQGLKEGDKLESPIYTPTTKAKDGHDEPISYEQTKEMLGDRVASIIFHKSIELFEAARHYANERGFILVDTKFEFGTTDGYNVLVGDEMLTPDSSRYWLKEDYKEGIVPDSYDKQILRNWLIEHGWKGKEDGPIPAIPKEVIQKLSERYISLYEKITGNRFTY